tara:strand:+ start:57 stop:548 length:492 start_codon:yes stop_codon:yes gene_type:complete
MNTTNNFFSELLRKNQIMKYNKEQLSLANYSPFSFYNNMLFISGQLPIVDNNLKYIGKISSELELNDIEQAILICTSNTLWHVSSFIDENLDSNFNNISCLNIKGYFNSDPSFINHSSLLDVASDLMIKVLGAEKGKHSRLAVGCSSLPKNSPVEIESIFSIY